MTSDNRHWNREGKTYGIDSYSSNGWKIGNYNGYTQLPLDSVPTTPFEIEYHISSFQSITTVHIGASNYVESRSNGIIDICGTNTSTYLQSNKTYHIKVYSNLIEVYMEDTLIGSKSISTESNPPISLGIGGNRYIELKDFKIKPL